MKMDLNSMKYAELRSIAKELGLKANMKADKLLKAIKHHYEKEKNNDEEAQVRVDESAASDSGQENVDDASHQEASSTAVFVNTRRGRGKCIKRKITDAAEAADPAESCSSAGEKKKKRKVTLDKDSEMNEAEPQLHPDSKDKTPVLAETEMNVFPSSGSRTEKAPKVVKGGKIPRYQGLQQKSKTLLKPTTPNFKKLHEAQFNKMESIDIYVQRKTKQMETYKNPVKDQKKSSARATMFSPGNKTPAEERRRHTLLSASKIPSKKPTQKEDGHFRPSVLSARRVNVRFSEATLDNEFKRSLVKTPARMSPCVASSTPQKPTADAAKPAAAKSSGLSAQKTPVVGRGSFCMNCCINAVWHGGDQLVLLRSRYRQPLYRHLSKSIYRNTAGPFIFTGNMSALGTPGTQKKPAFDLKASLSRPLTYKPHKGKLKPFGDVKENAVENQSAIANPRQESYKQTKIQTREDRRTKQMESRKQKKENLLGARRGLVMT
ncbi:nucleolar and spindle-associated protein 1 isoform X1 [Gambusia affinis]|uniref:nucleolar and spindle-associated protein 1 isoform X1 n=1 Tax=Gambusia affinis TaxID=33528 RepID=UPI001CDB942D|nr:nucleolar and spindle-associated protein 1 isoform X1 [Gambusia affinis]